jgi:hypothetical protein
MRLAKNDPYVTGAVIHGARPGLAQCSYNFIDSLQHDYRCSTDAPRRKIGLTSPKTFGSVFLSKISISAPKIELDFDDGMMSCDTSQRRIHDITHEAKKYNHQNARRTNTTERKTEAKDKHEKQEHDKGQTMKDTEQKPQKDDSKIAGQRIQLRI